MTTVEFHPAVHKDLKRLPKQFADYIVDTVVGQLERNQLTTAPLKGVLQGLQKIRVQHLGVSYRIIVSKTKPSTIQVLMVAKRGDIYQRLQQRLR